MSVLDRFQTGFQTKKELEKIQEGAIGLELLNNIYGLLLKIDKKLGGVSIPTGVPASAVKSITYYCGSAENFREKVAAFANNLRAIRREDFSARELGSFIRKEFNVPGTAPIYYTPLLTLEFMKKNGISKSSRGIYKI